MPDILLDAKEAKSKEEAERKEEEFLPSGSLYSLSTFWSK